MTPEEELLELIHDLCHESFGKSREQLQRILKKIRIMTRQYSRKYLAHVRETT